MVISVPVFLHTIIVENFHKSLEILHSSSCSLNMFYMYFLGTVEREKFMGSYSLCLFEEI